MADNLKIEDQGNGIVLLTLQRAPVNAMNPEFLGEIKQALGGLESNADVRGAVLASPFRVFSAGLDLREMQGYGRHDETAIVDALNTTFRELYSFAKPLVAAVNGAAIAGGLFLPLTADRTVATEDAKFGLSEVRVGAKFPVAPMEIARAELTAAGLRTLMLGGHPVNAQRAVMFGIVDEIARADDLLARAIDSARDLSEAPATTYAAVKAQLRAPALDLIDTAIRQTSDPTRDGWFTEETKLAMAAALAR